MVLHIIIMRVICTVALFCSQLKTVLAAKEQITPKNHLTLDDWRDVNGKQGDVKETWSPSSDGKEILTAVGKRGGASWFITPKLDLPKTSYLNISASCTLNCQLELYGQNDYSAKTSKFQPIENATFSNKTTKIITINTRKSYSLLRILARIPSSSSGKESRFTIYSINMYYYYCEEKTEYNTTLRRVNSSTEDIDKTVQCQDNSVSSNGGNNSNIIAKCTPQGAWDLDNETCDCLKGFEGSVKCFRCQKDFYKTTLGDSPCQKCPSGKTNNTMHTECDCLKRHYIGDDDNGPCYAVPPAVEELMVKKGKTSVKLTWKKPEVDQSLLHIGNLTFTIVCDNCNRSRTTFFPAKTNLTTTFINISGLVTNKSYTFKVFTMNSLKNVTWNYAEQSVTLPDYPNPTTPSLVTKANPGVTKIGGLEGGLIGIASTIIFAVVACLFMRRIRKKQRERSVKEPEPPPIPSKSTTLELKTHVNIVAESHTRVDILKDWEISPNDLKVLDKNLGAGQFGVVKQGLYTPKNSDPEKVAIKMLRENATESDLVDLLAEIKILKEANKEQHPNIIKFIGSCSLRGKLLMVTEFCPGGNLRKFLIKSRISNNPNTTTSDYVNIVSALSHRHLLKLAADVASGMVHLSSQNFLHRDLAARECILLGEENVAKICDFGLARDVGSTEEYIRNTQNLLPVKWMSLESLFDGVFTTASDVWSFGVLLYEITTLGEEPYKNIPLRAVITHVESGGRMSKPPHCSSEVYEIMSNCWKINPKERPTFPEILQALRDMLNDRKRSYINVTHVEDESRFV
ncbi:angiopoietin-1 receptor-like isoform X2 [Dendronephthya gigantea]|uniref:angiopoietin-1 receptor-like isoform X2 n=1 Tax=Dendronephthya gigantea TaxID=151771 RepID=UPI00106B2E8A|nr:angiopoietin-1 receptor-like isoform X2 [Dendronephthya gigantea]